MSWFGVVARVILAAVFLWAGISKLVAPEAFADGVADFQVFPTFMVNLVAMTVPTLEILAAGLLLVGPWKKVGALVALCLAVGFTVLFAWVVLQGRDVQCGCFGGGGEALPAPLGFLRAAVLLVLGGAVYLNELRRVTNCAMPAGTRLK